MANLVGILIILVMIVGAQAKDAMLQAEAPSDTVQPDEQSCRMISNNNRRWPLLSLTNLQRLIDKSAAAEIEIAYRRNERDRILTLITTAEKALEQQRGQLSAEAAGSARTAACRLPRPDASRKI